MRWLMISAVGVTLMFYGCTGVLDTAEGGGTGGPVTRPPPLPNGSCEVVDVPDAPLRHLTRAQYNNTLRDLLNRTDAPASTFPGDLIVDGFEVGTNMSPALVESYFDVADTIAEEAVRDLPALLECDPAMRGEATCGGEFLPRFLRSAFRRPPTAAEIRSYTALYDAAFAEQDFTAAIRVVVHAALASSPFLYHHDAPPAGASDNDIVPFSSFAMASRLSYLIWNSMPDETLFAAAEANELTEPTQIAEQARRMLTDPKASDGMRNFYRQWLELDAIDHVELDPEFYPQFDGQMRTDMRQSLEAYLDYAIWEDGGSFDAMFSGDTIFVNEHLAQVFEVDVTGNQLQSITAPAGERVGLLTQPGLLAAHSHTNQSSPVLRGYFIRTRFFCQHLPPPPPDVVFNLGDPAPGLSTRDRFAQHSTDPACSGCHDLMDPLGFGLENYDAIGRYRAEDEGVTVDARGEVIGSRDAGGTFDGPQELADRLANSDEVRECMAVQLFRYAASRTERASETCVLDGLFETAREQNWSVPELMVAMTQTEPFLFQRVPEGGAQ